MYDFLEYRVSDVMTPRPVAIRRDATLADVEALFERHNFNSLPVVENGNRLIGLVTKLDVLKAFLFTPRSVIPAYEEILRNPAERVMTWDPLRVAPDEPLTRVLQKMVHTRCKSFPVVSRDRLVGMIAREDILRALRLAAEGRRPRRPTARFRFPFPGTPAGESLLRREPPLSRS